MSDGLLLSKTLFQAGRECPKRMWYDRHEPDRKPPMSEAERARIQEGIDVGKLVQRRYPGGVTARYVGVTDEVAADKTRELIDEGIETIFEATFVADGRVVRCDVLWKREDGWVVDEVKATTGPDAKKALKDGHCHDVAYQVAALRRSGMTIVGAGLVMLNKAYVWGGGEHVLDQLFARIDLTDECEKLQAEIEMDAVRLAADLNLGAAPEAEINTHCKKCEYGRGCLADTPRDDVMFLPYATRRGTTKLREKGYSTIREIPTGVLTDQRMMPTHHVLTTGTAWVSEGLGPALDEVVFPAAFIDFESCQPAVPAYAGTNPYSQVCFQWSAHLLDAVDAEPIHREFLHPDASDPRSEFCRTLWEAIRDAKTVVIYSAFETTQVRKMKEAGIPFAAELLELLERATVDLEKVVSSHVCLEAFKYRTSIKTVLPALVPAMSYKGLAIADGTAAMTAYRRMIDPALSPEIAAKIRVDLLAYCCQDTLAMVEVFRALRQMIAGS